MTKEESLELMAVLKAAYPNHYNGLTKQEAVGVVSVWTLHFADIPAEIVFMAMQKAISESKFPPTISEVKAKITTLHWEAYEELRQNDFMRDEAPMPEPKFRLYKWIYQETKEYKVSRMSTPRIDQMIGSKMLEGRAALLALQATDTIEHDK